MKNFLLLTIIFGTMGVNSIAYADVCPPIVYCSQGSCWLDENLTIPIGPWTPNGSPLDTKFYFMSAKGYMNGNNNASCFMSDQVESEITFSYTGSPPLIPQPASNNSWPTTPNSDGSMTCQPPLNLNSPNSAACPFSTSAQMKR